MDEIKILIDGIEFSCWTGAMVNMSISNTADGFSLSCPFDPNDKKLLQTLKPFSFQKCKVLIGKDVLINGRIEKIESSLGDDGRIVTLQGRSLTGALIDCSIDGELCFYDLTLSQIASQVCKPFNVLIRADADTEPLDEVRAEYGQKVIEFLNSLARPRNFYFSSGFDGKLVIWRGSTIESQPIRARLIEGEAPVLKVSASYDSSGRYSIYKAATQFADKVDYEGSATDRTIKIFRPIKAALSDMDSDADVTAKRLRGEAIAKSFTASVTVAGWRRPDGERWSERQLLTLKAPSIFLDKENKYIISSVNYSLSTGDKTTTLNIAPVAAYSGGEMIWD